MQHSRYIKTYLNHFRFPLIVGLTFVFSGLLQHLQNPNVRSACFAALLLTSAFILKNKASRAHDKIPFQFSQLGTAIITTYVCLIVVTAVFFRNSPELITVAKHINNHTDWWLATFAAPVYEELFFRGSFHSELTQCIAKKKYFDQKIFWSVYLNAFVFWAFHFPSSLPIWKEAILQGGLPISPGPFLLGLVCTYVKCRGNHLIYCIIIHGLANGAGILFSLWQLPAPIFSLFYS